MKTKLLLMGLAVALISCTKESIEQQGEAFAVEQSSYSARSNPEVTPGKQSDSRRWKLNIQGQYWLMSEYLSFVEELKSDSGHGMYIFNYKEDYQYAVIEQGLGQWEVRKVINNVISQYFAWSGYSLDDALCFLNVDIAGEEKC